MSKEDNRQYNSCDDCFFIWNTDEEELVCPICGSWNIYQEN